MTSRKVQLAVGASAIAFIIVSVLYQSVESTVFFYTPNEIMADTAGFEGKTLRIGALVQGGSTEWNADAVQLSFRVTEDGQVFVPVVYNGVKPDMYRENQGVIVEGQLDGNGVFQANQVLVKHSEEYSIDQAQVGEKEAIYRTLNQ